MTATPPRLYKAVRPDGTSFYDRTTRWAVGEVVTHPAPIATARRAKHYLSAASTPTDCTGMQWPCRLLLVEPVGGCWQPDPEYMPHKWAAPGYRVLGELSRYDALGPQGRQVAALIDAAAHLTRVQLETLAQRPLNVPGSGAWEIEVHDTARSAGRAAAMVMAQEAIQVAVRQRMEDESIACVRPHLTAAVVVAAVVVRDLLDDEMFWRLTAPWRELLAAIDEVAS